MADPVTLTAAGIATLILVKALEKIGDKLGEQTIAAGGKLLALLQRKQPQTASKIELAAQQSDLAQQQPLVAEIVQEVETLAQQDEEVRSAVAAVAGAAQAQPGMIQNLTMLAEKIGVVNQGVILNQQNTLNF